MGLTLLALLASLSCGLLAGSDGTVASLLPGWTGLLIAFTEFGLLGLVLVALAVGVGFVGQAMPARTINSLAEHRSIYEALARHDADAAKQLMEQHIGNTSHNGPESA